MSKKIRRVTLFVLLFAMVLSISAFAATPKKAVTIETKPTTSLGSATADFALSQLGLVGGEAVDSDGNTVPGKFVWNNASEILEAGVYTRGVTFVPTDSNTYANASCFVVVKCYRLNLTVKLLPTVEGTLKTGEKVSELELTGGRAVNHFQNGRPAIDGHFEFVDKEQSFDKAGEYEVAVVFKPDNSRRYNDTVTTYARKYKNGFFLDAYVKVTVK